MENLLIERCVSLCRQGDHQAFAVIVKAFQQKVFGLCWQFLRDPQQARDAAADIFCKTFAHLDKYESGRSFPAWLLAIASNHLLQLRRSQKRRGLEQEIREEELADPAPGPEAESLAMADRAAVEAALASLPERYRLVLHLRFYEDLSYEEIAVALTVPPGTVGSLILRAKAQIRRELIRSGGFDEQSEHA